MSRRTTLGRLSALTLAAGLPAIPRWVAAQAGFPSRPLKIVVPTPPGGNLDAVSRAVGERLAIVVGQPVVVENRTGASSTVGTRYVAQSPADGYTLLTMANTFLSTPAVMANAGYDAVGDFTGVTMLVRLPNVIVVPANSPFQSLRDLIAGARAKPGEVTFASAGAGSVGHISAERFARDLGLQLVHVPYKGNGPALIDMVGGRVAMMFDQVSTSAPHIRNGRLRALAVTSTARSPALPDVPTMAEAGVKDFEDYTFNGFAVASATPKDVVTQLHAAVARALQDPELRARFTAQGMEVVPSASSEDFTKFMRDEVGRYQKLARDANIRVE